MTITEFLLARIAEDEDVARVFDDVKPRYYEVSGMEPSPEYVTVYVSPARVLAECAAKRAIVDARHEDDTCIRILAAVYSDHPDYNKAWRAV